VLGSPWMFAGACLFVVAWVLLGPYFDAWQLVINTSTTIGTFLMVFLLQNTQNRDTKAINIKFDSSCARSKVRCPRQARVRPAKSRVSRFVRCGARETR